MTTFSRMVIGTLCNVMQWVVDNDPAPVVDEKLAELRDSISPSTHELNAAVVAADHED